MAKTLIFRDITLMFGSGWKDISQQWWGPADKKVQPTPNYQLQQTSLNKEVMKGFKHTINSFHSQVDIKEKYSWFTGCVSRQTGRTSSS